jgi:hypothetical protein
MSTSPLTLQPVGAPKLLRVASLRLFHLFLGAWVADCVLDLDAITDAPVAGTVVLTAGGVKMSGTIDPRSSGTFGPSSRLRIVGGGGGWDKVVTRQDFAQDGGLTSTLVYNQTAAQVGEKPVVDALPVELGNHFVRSAGAASRVFRDNPWWVDVQGVTHVGPRLPSIADPSLLIRDYDPTRNLVTFSCDTLIYPGTPLVDLRFNGQTVTLQDVEQVFEREGSMGWGWAGQKASTELLADLKSATLEWTRAQYLRVQRYRLIQYQGPGPGGGPSRLALQAVSPGAGLPDIVPLFPYSGLAGAVNELSPSQEVLVIFENADPTLPRIVGYSLDGLPVSTSIDAIEKVQIGPSSAIVQLAGGATPLALGPSLGLVIAILEGFAGLIGSTPTLPGIVAAAAALESALTALGPFQTVKTVGA